MAKKNVQPAKDEVEVIVPDEVENTTSDKEIVAEEQVVEKQNKQKKEKKAKKQASVSAEEKSSKNDSKKADKDKNAKNGKDKKNNKAKKEKKSLKKKAAEIISELKKVSKPTFGQVVKNTCVVIVVVAICTLLLFGMDKLFSLIYDLLLPNS